jgi:SAM-dependent methyltransferase
VLSSDRARAESFGADADQYDRARPSYPSQLVDDLVAEGSDLAVLDVGCGTGIAARLFAGRGCRVLGVEPDPRMAAVARRHGLDVEVAGFEEWDAAGRTFDLVTCAQAWHWIDAQMGTAKAATLLGPGARVGLIWNEGTHGPELTPVLKAIYDRHGPALDDYSVLLGGAVADRVQAATEALSSSGYFATPDVTPYAWERVYSREEWLDQLPTHSDHRALPTDRLASLLADVGDAIDGLGGAFSMLYTAWTVRATRLDTGTTPVGTQDVRRKGRKPIIAVTD